MARTIGPNMQRGTAVAARSVTYRGATEDVVGVIITDVSGLPARVGFTLDSLERISPGGILTYVGAIGEGDRHQSPAYQSLVLHRTIVQLQIRSYAITVKSGCRKV